LYLAFPKIASPTFFPPNSAYSNVSPFLSTKAERASLKRNLRGVNTLPAPARHQHSSRMPLQEPAASHARTELTATRCMRHCRHANTFCMNAKRN